ncbi:MAG: TetR/AcrR family transcriptional regulator [Catenulispora sp.]|nr:TetR/AcrR family transcriptional regulator [Catenulispora sp.]
MNTSSRDRLLRGAVDYFAAHGVGDTSMRTLATALGTSHRMLHHHFGSRTGLLTAVVEAVEADQRGLLQRFLTDETSDAAEQLKRFWRTVSDTTLIYGPLFFELSTHAMHGLPHAAPLRASLVDPWLDPLDQVFQRCGYPADQSRSAARVSLAAARGLLLDLLVTGARDEVDRAMDAFIDKTIPAR